MTKALFILNELINEDLDWISAKSRKRIIQPGEILIYEAEEIQALYMVLSGILSVSIKPLVDRELARIYRGEVVGEISFIDNRPPVATVKGLEESVVLEITRWELTAKLNRNMAFAARFYRGISMCLADRMRGTVGRLGYGKDIEENLEDNSNEYETMNPIVRHNLELAEAKFNWLMANANY